MAFDIKNFYERNKDYYGDVPLEDVAKDAFTRSGMDQKYSYDDWKQQIGIAPIVEEDAYQRQVQKARMDTPGIFGELGRSLMRGVTQTVPQSIGKGIQWLNPDSGGIQAVEEAGKTIERFGDANVKRFPGITMSKAAEEAGDWNPRKWVASAGESIAQSVTPIIVGAAGAAIGGPVAGVAAGLGTLGGMFYAGTAEDTYRSAKEKGLSDEDAMNLANITGGVEAGGELVADLIPIKIFGGLGKAAKGSIIKSLTSRKPVKAMIGDVARTIVGEELTESGQQAIQTYAAEKYGVADQGVMESVAEVWGPTLITSLMFGAGGIGYNSAHRAKVRKALANPNVNPEERVNAVMEVTKAANDVDPTVGKNFFNQASRLLSENKPVIIDDDEFYNIGSIPAPGGITDKKRVAEIGDTPTPQPMTGPVTSELSNAGVVPKPKPAVVREIQPAEEPVQEYGPPPNIQSLVDSRRDVLAEDARMQQANKEPRGRRGLSMGGLAPTKRYQEAIKEVADKGTIPDVQDTLQAIRDDATERISGEKASEVGQEVQGNIAPLANPETVLPEQAGNAPAGEAPVEATPAEPVTQPIAGSEAGLKAGSKPLKTVNEVQAGEEPASILARPSDEIQKEIDDEEDRLASKYGAQNYFGSQEKSIIPPAELKRVRELYKEREIADQSDMDSWRKAVVAESGLQENEVLGALKAIHMPDGDLSIPLTADALKNWDANLTSNLERLYAHFANFGEDIGGVKPNERAEFRIGGTADNPTLSGAVFGEDSVQGEWNVDALKKVEKIYNAVSRTQGMADINLVDGMLKNNTGATPNAQEKSQEAQALLEQTPGKPPESEPVVPPSVSAVPSEQGLPASGREVGSLVRARDIYGNYHYLQQSDIDNTDKARLKTYSKDGTPIGGPMLIRDNLDLTGEKQKSINQKRGTHNIITRTTKSGDMAFASKGAAQAKLSKMGLQDTHEVVPVVEVGGKDGFVVKKISDVPSAQTVAPPSGKAGVAEPANRVLQPVNLKDVDSPAQGQLNASVEGKKRSWQRVKALRERIKAEPLNGNRSGLRLELIKAEGAHNEWQRVEREAKEAIEKRANELGQTTIKPTSTEPAPQPKTKPKLSPVESMTGKKAAGVNTRVKREMDEAGRPVDNNKVLPGDTFETATGKETTPYPKYSTKKSFKRDEIAADKWLVDNAIAEAISRGDDWNQQQFEHMAKSKMHSADVSLAQMYLFGKDQPKTVRSILKPLVPEATQQPSQSTPQTQQNDRGEAQRPEGIQTPASKIEKGGLKPKGKAAAEKTGKAVYTTPDFSDSEKAKTTGIPATQARTEFAAFTQAVKKSGHKIEFHDSLNDVPDGRAKSKAQSHEESTGRYVRAFYNRDTDTSHIITGRLDSMNDVVKVLCHESIGHSGLYKFMGSDLTPFLDFVLRHPGYGLDIKKVAKSRGIDFIGTEGRYQAAKEWFAEIAEKGDIQPTLLSRLVVAFKNALRRLGVKAEWLVGFSDKDVAEIIRGSRNAIIGEGAKYRDAGLIGKPVGEMATDYSDLPETDLRIDYSDSPQGQANQAAAAPFTGFENRTMAQIKTWLLKHGMDERWEKFAMWLYDDKKALLTVQKTLAPQPTFRDYNMLSRLMGSAITNEVKRLDRDYIKPLLQHMADNKLKTKDVEELAYAKHAPAFNLQMKRVNAKRYIDALIDNMTEAEARPYKERIDDIRSRFKKADPENSDLSVNDLRDEYVALLDGMAVEVAGKEGAIAAEIDKRQSDLDSRVFTEQEQREGKRGHLQKLIDNARYRLDQRAKLASQWESEKDRLSGITNEQAAEIEKKWAGNKAAQKAVAMLREIDDKSLDLLVEGGEITAEEAAVQRYTYPNHVPLMRENWADSKTQTGLAGTGPISRPLKRAGGSTKGVVNIFANVVDRHQAYISRKHKGVAGKALYEMVKANPDETKWSIEERPKKLTYDYEGNARFIYEDSTINREYQTIVKVNGKQHVITVPHDNPTMTRFIEAINRTPRELGPFMRGSAKIVRFMAGLNTSFAPEFLMTNFARDLQQAMVNLEDSEAKGLQKEVFKNIKAAIKGIYQSERGNESGEWAKIYAEYAKHGGKIGWMQPHENVAELAKSLEKELAYKEGKHPNIEKLRKLKSWVEAMNTAVENGVRLATYQALVKKGIDPKKAAYTAKTLTVDFTQHGTAGPAINSLYMFANAGIQGNVRTIKAIASSPKVRKLVTGIIGFGAMANIMGIMMGGDDDDGESYYDKLKHTNPDIFERNMVFMIPGTKGKYFKIPMPYGYNVFFVLGNEAASALRGKSPAESTARIGSALLGTLNPLQAATLLQTVMPTIGDPIAQWKENKAWHGGPLMPEKNPFGIPVPESERYFKSVNPVAKGIAQGLNSLTGGNKNKSGLIDVSPELFDMVFETYTGSAGRLVKDALSLPAAALSDDGVAANKVPFLRKVLGTYSDRTDRTIYRERSNEVGTLANRYKQSVDEKEKAELRKDPLFAMIPMHKQTDKQLLRLNKMLKLSEKMGNKEQAEKIRDRMTAIKIAYDKKYNELTK